MFSSISNKFITFFKFMLYFSLLNLQVYATEFYTLTIVHVSFFGLYFENENCIYFGKDILKHHHLISEGRVS